MNENNELVGAHLILYEYIKIGNIYLTASFYWPRPIPGNFALKMCEMPYVVFEPWTILYSRFLMMVEIDSLQNAAECSQII